MASNATKKKTAASKGSAASKKSATGSSRSKAKTAAVSTKRGNRQTVQEPAQDTTNPQIIKEVVLWLILAVCILIFISYLGNGGYVGEIISDVSFGVFGIAAYAFPFLLFLAAAFFISNKGNKIAVLKFFASAGLYLCICSFASLFTDSAVGTEELSRLYAKSAAAKNGGGVVGGAICRLLRPALGSIGTGIVLLILAIVFLLLITQKSLMRRMKQQSDRMYQSARESSARRKEAHRLEKEQRDAWSLEEENALPKPPQKEAGSGKVVDYQGGRSERKKEPAGHRGKKRTPTALGEGGYGERQTGRTEIDVPVLFPVHSRESRTARRVSGVTLDTKIQGNPEKVGAEIHEIIPGGKSRAQESGSRRSRRSAETSFIDLGAQEQQAGEQAAALYSENIPLHIEGIAQEDGCTVMEDEAAAVTHSQKEMAVRADDTLWGDHAAEPDLASPASVKNEKTQPGGASEALRDDAAPADGAFWTENRQENDAAEERIVEAPAEEESRAGAFPAEEKQQSDVPLENAPSPKRNPRSSQKEIEAGIASVEAEMAKAAEAVRPEYVYPPLDLLKKGKGKSGSGQEQEIRQTAAKLQQTLNSFGVHVTVTNVSCGPSVTRYELLPEQGVKVSRIVALSDDIKLNLAAADIRIEAPIPGKAAVGIEVPNTENSAVALRDLLESEEFKKHPSKLAFATGKDIGGKVVVSDIAKMPHLLIAGATGSGKSVCINTLIMSILYKANPDEVKLIMIDPKVVELSVYNGIPHLFIPVVTDPKKAAGALNWGVAEMTDRYNKFAELGVRDLKGYNQKIEALKDVEDENKPKKLPQIVIIVDELADLMMVAPGEVEDSICRLAQLARAAGIHLIIATQRPSVNVITGLIKANMPSRIAFSVSSGVDSRTIIDMNGAEKLLGKGDMLFYPQGYQKPARVQGAFVSDEEVSDVVDFLKNKNMDVAYDAQMEEQIAKVQQAVSAARGAEDTDALFADAGKFIIEKDKASIGMLQRVFKIGFNRAARIMDQLSEAGVVGPEEGTKPRKILMSAEQFENYLEEN